MAFTLPPLPYAYDALEPVIDEETLHVHHDKHHQAYVDNLNKAIEAEPKAQGKSLEELFAVISTLPKGIRNNGGGVWNHTFYWNGMAAEADRGAPSDGLKAAIDRDLGGMEAFREAFNTAGATQFGSGWAWLIVQDGRLKVVNTPNQDNPLMDIAPEKGTPLLTNDVWEHAYYLKYRNRRPDYLKAWWDVVNWKRVSALYAAAG